MTAVAEKIIQTRSKITQVQVSIEARASSNGTSTKLDADFADDVSGELCQDPSVVSAVADAHVIKKFKLIQPSMISVALESDHGYDKTSVAHLAALLWWTYCDTSIHKDGWKEFRNRWRPRWEAAPIVTDNLKPMIELAGKVLCLPEQFFTGDRMRCVKIRAGGVIINTSHKKKRKEGKCE